MLVIGNGESRKGIDLKKIKQEKIGCNAIYRDTRVDHLVCVDRRMLEEVYATDCSNYTKIYTRRDWFPRYYLNSNLHMVPDLPYNGDERWDQPFQWGSGPYAVLLAATLSESVELLGFDLYSQTKTVNNVYKGTKNYDPTDKRPVDPKYWIHQISKVFELYPQTRFTIYINDTWQQPDQWKKTNVVLDSISNL